MQTPQHLNWDQMHILLQLRIENYKWEFLSDLDGVGHGDKHEDDVGAIDMKAVIMLMMMMIRIDWRGLIDNISIQSTEVSRESLL